MYENIIKSPINEELEAGEGGVLLGYWDQEKTSNIVEELDNSVTTIEKKCKKLLQELIYFQYYWEDLNDNNLSKALQCKKVESSKTNNLKSTSVPDLAFRKAIIQSHGFQRSFQDVFEKKLISINEALTDAFKKIGIKENLFLFPTDKYLEELKENAIENLNKYLGKFKNDFVNNYFKGTVKSDLTLTKAAQEQESSFNISRISKNELEFYKKLPKINLLKKDRCKKLRKTKIVAQKSNFQKYKKILRRNARGQSNRRFLSIKGDRIITSKQETYSDGLTSKTNITNKRPKSKMNSRSFFPRKKSRKNKTSSCNNKSLNLSSISGTSNENSQTSLEKFNEKYTDIDTLCSKLVTALTRRHSLRKDKTSIEKSEVNGKTNFNSLVKKTIPFITCKSTTKSHNLGTNIQQYISARNQKPCSKVRKHNSNICGSHQPVDKSPSFSTPKLEHFQTTPEVPKTKSVNAQYIVTTYPRSPKENLEINSNPVDDETEIKQKISTNQNTFTGSKNGKFQEHEINHVERKNIWVTKQCSNNPDRKSRSRYTKTSPESFFGYHKSTMKEYTNGQESVIKSQSKTAYAVGSKIMVSDCQRTDFYGIKKQNHFHCACGDNYFNIDCNRLKEDWSRIYAMFSHLSKKYAILKEASGQPCNATLKTFENEIDLAIQKYKEFLNCYSKFLQLKHQLKSMKMACDAQTGYNDSSIIFSASYQKKATHEKPTYSMVLKETLRKVQDLQDRIRVLDEV